MRAGISVDGFEQPATDFGFDSQESALCPGVPKFDAAPPPAIDLVGEDFERERRGNRDRDTDARTVADHIFGLRPRAELSAYDLNASSCPRQSSSTCASHCCTG